LTAICMVASSFMLGLDWKNSLRVLKRDSRLHPSPNAGLPEAAAAGALKVRLGGPMSYRGALSPKPFIGDNVKQMDEGMVDSAIKIMHATGFLALFLVGVILMSLI
ncbi:MAG: cobalamin biosynthesis protein, partial [Deltaproteobacteria bacterium]|nr:cobalamin biosynthesis protein [Deltaproteobacteria bacterium]